jgi:hypothetical protein
MLKPQVPTAIMLSAGALLLAPPRAPHGGGTPSPSRLTVMDYLEIQQLVTRYAYALDSGVDSGRMYAGLFAHDGVFVQRTGQEISGDDNLAALAVRNQKGPLAVFHFILNDIIEPSPEGAIGKQYLSQLKIGENGRPSEVSGGGHYDDVYVKTPEGWRFKRRQFFPSQSGPQPTYQSTSLSTPSRPVSAAPATSSSKLTAADYIEIRQLVSRYPYGLDTGSGMGQMFAGLFTPDGLFTAGSLRAEGQDKLRAFAWQHRPGQGPLYVRNFSTNIEVQPSGDGATGRVFAVVMEIGESGQPSRILNGGHYEDVYVRTADGWRIKKREFIPSEVGPPSPELPHPDVAKETVPVPLTRATDPKVRSLTADDYVEIQQLAARYSHALDTGGDNGYQYADLFVPDGAAFDRWIGREKIAEIPRWNPHGPRYVRHYGFNHLIEPTADGAIGKQYVVVIDIGNTSTPSTIFLGGQYQDVYVRTRNGWRFKSRTEFPSASAAPAQVEHSSRASR